jgi:uncharacterized protein YbjT (DUF2867 family)
MHILLTGSTGMIGKGVLYECLDDPNIRTVTLINRSPLDFSHKKIHEIICKDVRHLETLPPHLHPIDACFFCLGATATTLSEKNFRAVTLDLTLHIAKTLLQHSPQARFIYVSGMGVSSLSKIMVLKVKGEAEDALLKLPFKSVHCFRPGYIQPQRGVQSKSTLYRWFYMILSPFYPLLKRLAPNSVTSTRQIGRAMIHVASTGHSSAYLENSDINDVAMNE